MSMSLSVPSLVAFDGSHPESIFMKLLLSINVVSNLCRLKSGMGQSSILYQVIVRIFGSRNINAGSSKGRGIYMALTESVSDMHRTLLYAIYS